MTDATDDLIAQAESILAEGKLPAHSDDDAVRWNCRAATLVEPLTAALRLLRLYTDSLRREAKLRALLNWAADEIADWGAYASEYFQAKHDLAGTVKRFRDVARSAGERSTEPIVYASEEAMAEAAAGHIFPDGHPMNPLTRPEPDCHCESCDPIKPDGSNARMIVCAICGNKRCPHATNHRNACTGSNEPGQPGSSYEFVPSNRQEIGSLLTKLLDNGYSHLKRLPDGTICGVAPMAYTGGLFVGLDASGYRYRYCYETVAQASEALGAWNGEGDPPGAWIVRKGLGEDRIGPGGTEKYEP